MSKLDKLGYLVAAAEHFGSLGVSLSVAGTAHGIGRDVWTTFRRGCSHADRGSVAVSAVIMWRHVGVGIADTRRATVRSCGGRTRRDSIRSDLVVSFSGPGVLWPLVAQRSWTELRHPARLVEWSAGLTKHSKGWNRADGAVLHGTSRSDRTNTTTFAHCRPEGSTPSIEAKAGSGQTGTVRRA